MVDRRDLFNILEDITTKRGFRLQEGAVYQDPLPGGTQENPLTLRVEFKNDRFYFTILETQESMQFHIDFFEKSAFCEGNPHRAYRFIQEIWRAIPPRPLE